MQYESPISSGKKVMAKLKVFSKLGQTSRSTSQGQLEMCQCDTDAPAGIAKLEYDTC